MTATIETNLRQGDPETGVDGMKGDLTETEMESNEALTAWEEERQKSRADEFRSRSLLRRSSPQSVRRFLWPCDSMDGCAQRRGCGRLAKAQASARVDVATAAHFFSQYGRTKESNTCVQVLIFREKVFDMCTTDNRP